MNYKAELVVVITVGKIDVIVKDEKMLYLPNREYPHYVIKFNVNHLDLIRKTYKLLYKNV